MTTHKTTLVSWVLGLLALAVVANVAPANISYRVFPAANICATGTEVTLTNGMTCKANGNCATQCDKDYHRWFDNDDNEWKRTWYCECDDNVPGNLPWPGGDGCHIVGITDDTNTPLDRDCTADEECDVGESCYETPEGTTHYICECSGGT